MNDLMMQLLEEQREALERAKALIGSLLLDTYRVEDVLGAGTYGVTLKAQDTMVDQPVAIKWIYRAYRDTVKSELRMLAELSDLSCVPRYRTGKEEEGEFYLVMDYIGGGDLGKLIERGSIPLLQGLDLSLKLFRALSMVHAKRIGGRRLIHRDIKPANLLLDEKAELYITDFGAARVVSTTHQSRLSGTGTAGFMAPETITGRYDQRVDIYSAGMVMYYLFGGQEPADPESLFYEEPLLSGEQKERLWEIVDRAIAKQEDARYGSAEEVAVDLEEVLGALSGDVEESRVEDMTLSRQVLVDGSREDMTLDRDILAGPSEETEAQGGEDLDAELARLRREVSERERAAKLAEIERLRVQLGEESAVVAPDRESLAGTSESTAPEVGESRAFDLPGGATTEMVWIPPGTFMMGSPDSDEMAGDSEKPQHEVKITKGFWLGKCVITQGQWESVMGTTPWSGEDYVQSNADHPAVHVSWEDMQEFIGKLNRAEGSEIYRLPTEAEWEYACRAGTATRWSFGDAENRLGDYAWYGGNAWGTGERYAHRVGTKQSNGWGLHDMHGNVYEWCQDWYGEYTSGSQEDPMGAASGSNRVLRGGSFGNAAQFARSAHRNYSSPGFRSDFLGARLLR